MIAFTTAATIPIIPARIESIPTNPPRTLDRDAETIPINPNTIATIANTNPNTAPVVKLRIAATIAMIANTLNFAGEETCCSIT